MGDIKMVQKSMLYWIGLILVIIGGINWGLVGLFQFDLVEALLGSIPIIRDIVYILVGIAAVYMIYFASQKQVPG